MSLRDQGNEGACWSLLLRLNESVVTVGNMGFSENNMVNLASFDWGFSDGGNISMATAYLVR